jgi:alkylhydroperoxidase family enzyme
MFDTLTHLFILPSTETLTAFRRAVSFNRRNQLTENAMALIKTYTPENAEGPVKEYYDRVLNQMPFIPKPMQMMSASPELLGPFAKSLGYVAGKPEFNPAMLGFIRYLVSFESGYPYCVDLNSGLVKMLTGVDDEKLAEIRSDFSKIPLSEKENALIAFAVKVVKEPEAVVKDDIDLLHELGWTDVDIFDAAYHGAWMVTSGILFNAFKIGED